MSTTFEFGRQPDTDQVANGAVADKIAWQAQDIYVVMASAHFSHDFVVARSGTNVREFISGDRHTNPGSTDQNTSFDSSIGDTCSDFQGVIWIVDGTVTLGAEIERFVSVSLQECDKLAFDLVAAMIASEC
jgi:hypothetical protein